MQLVLLKAHLETTLCGLMDECNSYACPTRAEERERAADARLRYILDMQILFLLELDGINCVGFMR